MEHIINRIILISFVMIIGCLHHPGLTACQTQIGEESCWESKRFDEENKLRHHVVERTINDDKAACDLIIIEQTSYDVSGFPIMRIIDAQRCLSIDKRVIEKYDWNANIMSRTILEDLDHNDSFDKTSVEVFKLP